MNVTIFGATGSIGRHLVEQALDGGHHVVAVTRDPSRITTQHPELEVMQGDATDPEDAL